MKKTLYMVMLIVVACILGGLIGGAAYGSLGWLGYTTGFDFQPGTFINTSVLTLTFGLSIYINIAQILLILVAIYVYYKTAPKLITGK